MAAKIPIAELLKADGIVVLLEIVNLPGKFFDAHRHAEQRIVFRETSRKDIMVNRDQHRVASQETKKTQQTAAEQEVE
jgi:hypothetical protein